MHHPPSAVQHLALSSMPPGEAWLRRIGRIFSGSCFLPATACGSMTYWHFRTLERTKERTQGAATRVWWGGPPGLRPTPRSARFRQEFRRAEQTARVPCGADPLVRGRPPGRPVFDRNSAVLSKLPRVPCRADPLVCGRPPGRPVFGRNCAVLSKLSRPRINTVHLQGDMVGQTISFCRLPGSRGDRPRKAMVCFLPATTCGSMTYWHFRTP
jgi:hypothetical protein